MAVILVTYDLKQPGRDYKPVHDYLRTFTHCKGMESVWLLDTARSTETIRDDLRNRIDSNDVVFVVRLMRQWNSWNYTCGDWLNAPERSW
jgi:hypothetical protein